MILTSFFKALSQIFDGRFLRVLGWGILLSIALLVAVYTVFLIGLTAITPDEVNLWFFGPVDGLHTLLGFASFGVMLLLSAFLMVPVAAVFAGLFVDDVIQAVEDRHYPWLGRPLDIGFFAGLKASINLIGLIIVLNFGLILLTPFIGPLAVPLYFGLNGYLLGREYFTAVASRRMLPEHMEALRKANGTKIWIAGALMALPLSIPLVNLLIPVLGTATFTHLFHRIRDERP